MIDWKSLADDPPPEGIWVMLGRPGSDLVQVRTSAAYMPEGFTHWVQWQRPAPLAPRILSEMRGGVLWYAEIPADFQAGYDSSGFWKPFPQTVWLPFSERSNTRLKPGEHALVKTVSGRIVVARRGEMNPWSFNGSSLNEEVTHWHPLPKETDS